MNRQTRCCAFLGAVTLASLGAPAVADAQAESVAGTVSSVSPPEPFSQTNPDGAVTNCEVYGATLATSSGQIVNFAVGGVLSPDSTLDPRTQQLVQTLQTGAAEGTSAIATVNYDDSDTLCGTPLRNFVTSDSLGPSPSPSPSPPPSPSPTPPSNTARPVISGQLAVGAVLTESTGTWTGLAPLTFSYQWNRCKYQQSSPGVSTCVWKPIPGAIGSTYTVVDSDLVSGLSATVTATNSAGSGQANPTAAAAIGPVTDLHGEPAEYALPASVPSVPWILRHSGVTGFYRARRPGRLDITWTALVNRKSIVIARGRRVFHHKGRSKVKTVLTARGRAALRANYLLPISISAGFTPFTGPSAGSQSSSASTLSPITF